MFAVIQIGGKQYKVVKDDILKIEKITSSIGDTITFNNVFILYTDIIKIGTPTVKNSSVICKIIDQKRDKKIIVFKKKRRQNYRRKAGHRQYKTVLKVLDILF